MIVAALMWVGSAVAVGAIFGALLRSTDPEFADRADTDGVVVLIAAIAAVALFLGSGPVAFWIGRRRWLFGLPLLGLAAWGVGIVVAYVT